jgi:perosamine synthetase
LKVWGIDQSEVICPAYTCVVVADAVVLSSNIPVFVDCAEGSFNMSYEGLEAALTEKTRAILVTHLWGYAMDVQRVAEIVSRAEEKYGHKIYVIQDCAHSYGARWQGKIVTQFGDASIFGSNIAKIINSIFGGMVLCHDQATSENLRTFRQQYCRRERSKSFKRLLYFVAVNLAFNHYVYGLVHFLERNGWLDRFVKYYEDGVIAFPTDWDLLPCETEARVGRNQLRKYDRIIADRQQQSRAIIEALKTRKDIWCLPFDPDCTYSHLVALVEDRSRWMDFYLQHGVQLGMLIEYSIPYMEAYRQYSRGDYPVSKSYSERAINFPTWPDCDFELREGL